MAVTAPTSTLPTIPTLPKRRFPAGRPRAWYEAHNRQLKAMRLAIALLHTGAYQSAHVSNRRIRFVAARIGVRPPSVTTCRLVRSLIESAGAENAART